jgi:hypothetical protein
MSSKMNLKGKIFFRWAFLCLVIMVNKSTTQLTNYQLTQVVTKLEKQLNSEKVHFDETITALKNQFKTKLVQLKNEAKSNFNQTMVTVNTLSKTVERLEHETRFCPSILWFQYVMGASWGLSFTTLLTFLAKCFRKYGLQFLPFGY